MREVGPNRDPRPQAKCPTEERRSGSGNLGQPQRIDGARFICPGCGKTATAKDGWFCCGCGHFVHAPS